jgi:RNA ligase (TIGR02306 family)
MRKLVTIRKVLKIDPIVGADNIELCLIGGWQCITRIGEFKEGDLALYFEIDSFLPERAEFEFLRASSFKTMHTGQTGFRLRTMKLRKVLSQGLLLPLSLFSLDFSDTKKDYAEDLGVILWEPKPNPQLEGVIKGNFPTYIIPKTDQERIQNLPEWFTEHSDVVFEITEKLDGTSVTCFLHEGEFGVCSRNLELKRDENNTLWKIAIENKIEEKLKSIGKNLALQGELVGPGIQKNPLQLKELTYFVYDVFDISEQKYLGANERFDLVTNLGLNHVPLISYFKILDNYNMEELLEFAKGDSTFGKFKREGIVCKAVDGSISFKAINNDYLLKHKED